MSNIVIIIMAIAIFLCSGLIYWKNYKNKKDYKTIRYKDDLSGFEIAEKILENNGLDNLYIVETRNYLEERYDSNRNVIRLLPSRFHGLSMIDGTNAAFLASHAIFDKKNTLLHIRNCLLFITNILIYVCYGSIIVASCIKNYDYLKLGVLGLFVVMIFHLITLPVEKEVGNFVLKSIKELKLLDEAYHEELSQSVDALTYRYLSLPVSLIGALINLLKNKFC